MYSFKADKDGISPKIDWILFVWLVSVLLPSVDKMAIGWLFSAVTCWVLACIAAILETYIIFYYFNFFKSINQIFPNPCLCLVDPCYALARFALQLALLPEFQSTSRLHFRTTSVLVVSSRDRTPSKPESEKGEQGNQQSCCIVHPCIVPPCPTSL